MEALELALIFTGWLRPQLPKQKPSFLTGDNHQDYLSLRHSGSPQGEERITGKRAVPSDELTRLPELVRQEPRAYR